MTDKRTEARRSEDQADRTMIVVRDHGANLAFMLGAILAVVLIAASVGGYATWRVFELAEENKERSIAAKALAAELERETQARAMQTCRLFLSNQTGDRATLRRERRRLAATLKYLREAPKPLRGIDLAVQRNVGQVRRDVSAAKQELEADRPPAFCDRYRR